MKADPFVQLRLLDLQALDSALNRLAHRRRTLPELAEIIRLEGLVAASRDDVMQAETAVSELIDNCYTGWNGVATLSAPGGASTTLTASPACRWLHIYSPPGADFVCAEPVANRPDPFQGEDSGIRVDACVRGRPDG